MSTEHPTCATCKHWTPTIIDHFDSDDDARAADSPEARGDAEWGSCRLIGPDRDEYESRAAKANPTVLAFTRDSSDYWSALHTRPSLGCVLHEPNTPEVDS